MAFLDFASTQYVRTIDTSEELRIGSFQTQDNFELSYIRLTAYIEGLDKISSEKVGIKIYSDDTYKHVIATSTAMSLSDIVGTGSRWLGWIRVDFNRENINKKLIYYPVVYTQNYTLDPVNVTLAFAYDFPYPIYDNSENLFYNHPLQHSVFGYKLQ